jgi:hypothetical protein
MMKLINTTDRVIDVVPMEDGRWSCVVSREVSLRVGLATRRVYTFRIDYLTAVARVTLFLPVETLVVMVTERFASPDHQTWMDHYRPSPESLSSSCRRVIHRHSLTFPEQLARLVTPPPHSIEGIALFGNGDERRVFFRKI